MQQTDNITLKIILCILSFQVYLFLSYYVTDKPKNTKTPETKNFTEFNGNSKHRSRYRRILIRTKLYGDLGKIVQDKKVQCDMYECEITKKRKLLSKSNLIVFHPKFTKGIYDFVLHFIFTFIHKLLWNKKVSFQKIWTFYLNVSTLYFPFLFYVLCIIISDHDLPKVHLGQKWLIQNRESPAHSSIQNYFDGNFSLACTYHRDWDVPCYYGFYIAFGNLTTLKSDRSKYFIPSKLSRQLKLHSSVPFSNFNSCFLMGYKNKLILWIYSNCKVKYRVDYAKQLLKSGIEIDIYGKCGKTDPCKRNQECLISMYKKYKFYLAFENSQCYDYITEKVWKSLYYGMVPIVYGAPLESYF